MTACDSYSTPEKITHRKQELEDLALGDKAEHGKAGQVTSETVPLGWSHGD